MKFISILRKAHISDEYAVAHSRLSLLILKEKVILRIYSKPILWQLCPVLAMLLHHQPISSQTLRPRIREEAQRKVALRQLADLPCPLHRIDTVHFDCLFHHLRNYAIPLWEQRTECRGRCHISALSRGCTSISKISGAWCQTLFELFTFRCSKYKSLIFNKVRFLPM